MRLFRKIMVLACAAALTASVFLVSKASDVIPRVKEYTPGQFTDIAPDAWCADNVKAAYELGIMGGKSETVFDAEDNLTVAQAIVMACRLHSAYVRDDAQFEAGSPWYAPYLDYAREHGIQCEYSAYDVPATRAQFAVICGSALPDSYLPAIGSVQDGAIPDVPTDASYYEAVYRLYRAGVLAGNDALGTFTPGRSITRGAAAALVSRLADPELRKPLNLKKQFIPVPVEKLQNLTSLKKKCTESEFKAAYDRAVELVRPLADKSREDQLRGIKDAIRAMVDSGKVSYTTNVPHYNDPYGYFVTGVGSCAGCARATGLCLNILGIEYEHVNEDQWSHQWCRVKMDDGTFWICDAYGLFCGPEPAPYTHPYL